MRVVVLPLKYILLILPAQVPHKQFLSYQAGHLG